jgi:hypothetical protein
MACIKPAPQQCGAAPNPAQRLRAAFERTGLPAAVCAMQQQAVTTAGLQSGPGRLVCSKISG